MVGDKAMTQPRARRSVKQKITFKKYKETIAFYEFANESIFKVHA